MGSVKFVPENEMQTREWFAAHIAESEYDLIGSQAAFPDWVLRDESGKMYRVEVEYKSKSFIQHGHDPHGCDFVLCWIHNARLSLPVLELETGEWYEAGTLGELQDLQQQYLGGRAHQRRNKRKSVRAIKNKNQLLEAIGNKVGDEYGDFLLCFADSLRARSEFSALLVPSQSKLLKAGSALTIALRNLGFDVDDLRPDDLFKLLV